MHRWGHLGAALLAYAPVGGGLLATGHDRLAVVGGVVAAACATLPDADELLPGVDHRGPTHTLWFALGLGALVGSVGSFAATATGSRDAVAAGAVAGSAGFLSVASHVGADSLTPMGIRPFAPLRDDDYGFDVVYSKNPRGNYAMLAAGVLATAVAAVAGRWRAGRRPGR